MSALRGCLESFIGAEVQQDGDMVCESRLSEPATAREVQAAWPQSAPPDILNLWAASRESFLFEDVDFGWWGLHLFSPTAAADTTKERLAANEEDYRADDVVIGELMGEVGYLVYAPSEEGVRRLLVVAPMDQRDLWWAGGANMSEFLERYKTEGGRKFWENEGYTP